jgi:hypothetical protein
VLGNPALREAHDEILASDDAPEFAAPAAEETGVVPGSLARVRAAAAPPESADESRNAMPPPDPRTLPDMQRPPSSESPPDDD